MAAVIAGDQNVPHVEIRVAHPGRRHAREQARHHANRVAH
jgi:hypothetical protein